jgi:uncharacterized SAM-binding protein YcdF (DUF218 family)
MFVLFKWFLWLAMPFTWVLLVCFAIAGFLWYKRLYRWASVATAFALFIFLLSLPSVARSIGCNLESSAPIKTLAEIPTADAIILLGGGVGAANEVVPYPDCFAAADRVVMAARLYHAGKAPLVIPAGEISERAELPLLQTMCVPPSSIVCDAESRDTAENAQRTVEILRKLNCKRVLLVTSAWHMRRAMMMYEGCGLEIIPVGCDYESTLARAESSRRPLWMELPSAAALNDSCVFIKEYLGILFYAMKGNAFESEK